MNILFINTQKGTGLYGVEQWMINLGRALIRENHWVGLAGRKDSPLQEVAEKNGIRYFPFRVRSGLEIFDASHLHYILREHKVNAICTKMYKETRISAMARIGLQCKIFVHRGAMGDVKNTFKDRFTLTCCTDGLIVPSNALQSEFCSIAWLCNLKKIYVIPCGIDISPYRTAANSLKNHPQGKNVIYIGRLMNLKGIDILLKSWSIIHAAIPDAKLTLVGDDMENFRKMVSRAPDIAGSVEFTGFQTDIKPWLAKSDILVLPSRKEGAGIVLVEAMAMGKPIVASRIGGIPDYVRDGETGILVPPESPEALAKAIIYLLSSPEKIKNMGLAGQKRAESEFDISKIAKEFLTLLQK